MRAGLRQIMTPAFTAQSVFHLEGKESHVVIRELGFASLCMSLVAIISLFAPEWRMAGAFVGGLYRGLAGFMHVFKRPEGPNEGCRFGFGVKRMSWPYFFPLALEVTLCHPLTLHPKDIKASLAQIQAREASCHALILRRLRPVCTQFPRACDRAVRV